MNERLLLLTAATKYRLHNLVALFRKKGTLICPNGFVFEFQRKNERDIKKLFEFSITYGVNFSEDDGFWHYGSDILVSPNGINFSIHLFDPLVFAETYLFDVHFTGFDLKGRVVIQAGGFTGDTALYYAFRGAKVFSFEPGINTFNQALENIKLNPELSDRIVMKNYALGSDGEIEFPIDPMGSGGLSVYSDVSKNTIKVRSVSIQTILRDLDIDNPYLLDLDIKGSEFEIIKENCISRFSIVRIEYITMIGGKNLGKRDELIKRLKELGFNNIRIFKHNETRLDLMDHGTIEAFKS